mmetsp:Transcript_9598/g.19890  ORF Transcript_9598/g.19890 Transcript_9598/m.19890 type:complete len:263 (-) Transcript_9598:499-1287(-)
MMPFRRHRSRLSTAAPNAGFTSSSAASKSAIVTLMFSSRIWAERSLTSSWRLRAKEVADLTSPSISAPLKFLVMAASSSTRTSRPRNWLPSILAVWMWRICVRPRSSGRPISTCTSNRPGRMSASSSRSLRLVMPMSRMLFSASTPSTFVSSWFTSESLVPVLSPALPLDLQMASISSKMMMWRSLLSPFARWSSSASLNRLRMFSSDWPTYLLSTSGPFTTLGSRALSSLPIWRAISVLPVPGGPNSSMPLTCLIPSFSTM